ncbi:MAG: hypothetical protein KatS3mg032_2098 [Cyclobacteriaceae bacterium]|nr:MAG: hypothetical protein KatS3mg032_2098 [Cyclobacteriaceae bacterium]
MERPFFKNKPLHGTHYSTAGQVIIMVHRQLPVPSSHHLSIDLPLVEQSVEVVQSSCARTPTLYDTPATIKAANTAEKNFVFFILILFVYSTHPLRSAPPAAPAGDRPVRCAGAKCYDEVNTWLGNKQINLSFFLTCCLGLTPAGQTAFFAHFGRLPRTHTHTKKCKNGVKSYVNQIKFGILYCQNPGQRSSYPAKGTEKATMTQQVKSFNLNGLL